MKKNVRNNVCVTVALVCLALVVLFAYFGCVGSSPAPPLPWPWRQAPGSWWPSTA